MTGLSSSSGQTPDQSQSSIQKIESQLKQYISDAEKKGELTEAAKKNVFQLREQIQALSKNKSIPEDVRDALQQAVATLKPQKGESLDVSDLQNAKSQLDEILGKGEAGL